MSTATILPVGSTRSLSERVHLGLWCGDSLCGVPGPRATERQHAECVECLAAYDELMSSSA